MKSCRSSSRRKKRRRMMRKLFRKPGTGMTGRIRTPEATATGRTWADVLAAEGAGPGNPVRIARVLEIEE